MSGLKLRVTSLDPLTGRETDVQSLSSEGDVTTPDQILYVGANSASPLIAWTDKGHKALKVNILGTKTVSTLQIEHTAGEEITAVTMRAPQRPTALTHFLVHFQTATSHWADVYHVNLAKSTISKAYSLPKVAGAGSFSCSTVDANVFFTRITESEMILVSSASHGILGRWSLATSEPIVPVQVTAEVAAVSSTSYPTRAAILTSNGEWILFRNGDISWSRPEFLTGATTAVFADMPEEQSLVHQLEMEGHQGPLGAYLHRLKRHINDLRALPSSLRSLLASFLGSKSSSADGVQKDKFGFRKYVVIALEDGRLVAIDSSSAAMLWTSSVKWVAHGEKWEAPELRMSPHGTIEVWLKNAIKPFVIDTNTGDLVMNSDSDSAQQSTGAFSFELMDSAIRAFSQDLPKSPIWQFMVPTTDRIVGVAVRPTVDPVASIGKVLGDRRVLYKYLNSNVALVASVNDVASSLTVTLLDTVSGTALYSTSHSGVDTSKTVASTVAENWFAYSYTLDASKSESSRGYQIVVSEMFESPIPNDRGPLGSASNYSSLGSTSQGQPLPHIISATFQIPEAIEHMSVTRTRQGITSRELLVTLTDSHGIVAIPRQLLDPRRPVGRGPTADETAEGLMQYTPTLEFDPKWYLNHQREVLGVKDVITSPSVLESTSLVFAYGLDIFGTRVAPSFSFDVLGKGFNKLQMMATVGALGVAVVFVAPFVCLHCLPNKDLARGANENSTQVQRKQINQRWQFSS